MFLALSSVPNFWAGSKNTIVIVLPCFQQAPLIILIYLVLP